MALTISGGLEQYLKQKLFNDCFHLWGEIEEDDFETWQDNAIFRSAVPDCISVDYLKELTEEVARDHFERTKHE